MFFHIRVNSLYIKVVILKRENHSRLGEWDYIITWGLLKIQLCPPANSPTPGRKFCYAPSKMTTASDKPTSRSTQESGWCRITVSDDNGPFIPLECLQQGAGITPTVQPWALLNRTTDFNTWLVICIRAATGMIWDSMSFKTFTKLGSEKRNYQVCLKDRRAHFSSAGGLWMCRSVRAELMWMSEAGLFCTGCEVVGTQPMGTCTPGGYGGRGRYPAGGHFVGMNIQHYLCPTLQLLKIWFFMWTCLIITIGYNF